MKAIFSHIHDDTSETSLKDYVKLTALSNYFAQKNGFETVFFTDEKNIKFFKKINFDNIQILNTKNYNYLPKCFWSVYKLISILEIKEPCIHIDNDLFLTKPLPEAFLKNDIIAFHSEDFAYKTNHHDRLQSLIQIQPPETFGFETISYNCGIMGGMDINTLIQSINLLFNFIEKHRDYIDKTNSLYHKTETLFVPSVLIEQIWLFQILKFFKKKITTLISIKDWNEDFKKKSIETGYIHLMGQKKYFLPHIEKTLIKKNIKY